MFSEIGAVVQTRLTRWMLRCLPYCVNGKHWEARLPRIEVKGNLVGAVVTGSAP